MSFLLVLILALILGELVLDVASELLNIRKFEPALPREFEGIYDPEKYRRSQEYQRERARFHVVQRVVGTGALVAFLLLGGFNWIDQFARGFGLGPIWTGLLFVAALSVLRLALSLPFSIYSTFVIEERFGFNRTSPATFVGDLFKGLLLGALIGAPILAAIFWFFGNFGEHAWLYAWIAVSFFQILLTFIAPVLLMPLFNKFEFLPDGDLKRAIDEYARGQDFRLNGVYVMDGSKRSSKANAFFTGFGGFRRLVVFDTLVQKQTVPELVAVVAHEVGHYKRGHIPKSIGLALLSTGVMFYALGALLGNPALFEAFRMEQVSVYASVIFLSILAGPVMRLAAIATNGLSRKFEYEADEFSVQTYGEAASLASALKKLSIDSMSHLTPHRLKVLLDYSHPPILLRIEALRAMSVSLARR